VNTYKKRVIGNKSKVLQNYTESIAKITSEWVIKNNSKNFQINNCLIYWYIFQNFLFKKRIMSIKTILQFFLTVTLFSSCFKNNLFMEKQSNSTLTDYKKHELDAKNEEHIYCYEEFTKLIDDEEISLDEIMNFIKEKEVLLRGNNMPFIHYIVEKGEYDILEEMLKKEEYNYAYHYNAGEDDCTPLHVAAQKGDIGIVKLFINTSNTRLQETLNAKDINGNNALHYACATNDNNTEVVKLLIEKM
jgi:hypothetical protein